MRVAYFTAGSHGAGHLVRGVALWRALQRRSRDVTFRLFAPASPFASIAAEVHQPVSVDPQQLRDPHTAKSSSIAREFAAFAPDVLIVDLFWVPLAFVPLPCRAWLLLRSVPPVWLVGPKEARFDASRYERVFAMEPAPGLKRFESLAPIVVANRDEVRTREELCARLKADPSRPLHLLARAGLPSDLTSLSAIAPIDGAQVRDIELTENAVPFPAAPWFGALAGNDRLVAAPGYNTYWESHWLGFAERVTWVPIKRVFDDAVWRAQCPPPKTWNENGADTLARLILG